MPNLPENTPEKRKSSAKIKLLFFAAAVLFFSVLLFIALRNSKQEIGGNFTNITFSNQSQQEQYKDFIASGFEKGSNGFGDLKEAFLTLKAEYLAFPSAEKRELLVNLQAYLKNNFPEEFMAATWPSIYEAAVKGGAFYR